MHQVSHVLEVLTAFCKLGNVAHYKTNAFNHFCLIISKGTKLQFERSNNCSNMFHYSTVKYRPVTMADMGRKEKGDVDGYRWFS
jgi:hypothetical protein